jgi:hypothetical protein
VHPEVGAGDRPQLLLHLLEGRRDRAVLGHPLGRHDDPVDPVSDRAGAEAKLGLADLRHHRRQRLRGRRHLHFAHQRVDPAGLTRKVDADQPAHRAAAAVAADEVAGAQLRAVRQLDAHPEVVLAQSHQLAAAPNLDAELFCVLGQQAIGDRLRDSEDVRMGGVQVARRRLGDSGEEATDRVLLAERQELVQQTALVHHLDAAGVQAERADHFRRLGLLLQHQRLHPLQLQLTGQHQPGRPTADHDHVDHWYPSSSARFVLRPVIVGHHRGLAASPPVRDNL